MVEGYLVVGEAILHKNSLGIAEIDDFEGCD
jgi:hypothetical protein